MTVPRGAELAGGGAWTSAAERGTGARRGSHRLLIRSSFIVERKRRLLVTNGVGLSFLCSIVVLYYVMTH